MQPVAVAQSAAPCRTIQGQRRTTRATRSLSGVINKGIASYSGLRSHGVATKPTKVTPERTRLVRRRCLFF